MTIPRLVGLLAVFGALGIIAVVLRADQVRRSHHIQRLHFEQVSLERTMRTKRLEIARLRSPRQIRERAERFDVPLVPPYDEVTVLPADESWVADQ
ncbi:MAG: hypothetical protein JXA69_18205 [Phycisphaerae bacterium]|nr:hypothetical protein [Phycisphaerae bacterium]